MLYAVGANAEHGLSRSNANKRRAVQMRLEDPESLATVAAPNAALADCADAVAPCGWLPVS